MTHAHPVIIALALLAPALSHAAPKAPAAKKAPPAKKGSPHDRIPTDLKVIESVVFKKVGDQSLDLMLFLPDKKDVAKMFVKSPLVVYVHGGGWGGGDKYRVLRKDNIDVIRQLNKLGVTCASIEYRLANGQPATANDAVADCKDSLRYLAQHAGEYSIDPDRIGTFGSSAGGHLTLVTALGKDDDYPLALEGPPVKVRCVAAYYPLVSFVDRELMKGSNFERPQRLIPLLGGPLEEKTDLAKKLSPIDLLTPASPPIFLAHGDNDVVLSYTNSTAMRDAAQAKGVPCECIISHGAGHGFSGDKIDPDVAEINRRTVAFFVKYLTGK
jgi:acetyl esterase/lipase